MLERPRFTLRYRTASCNIEMHVNDIALPFRELKSVTRYVRQPLHTTKADSSRRFPVNKASQIHILKNRCVCICPSISQKFSGKYAYIFRSTRARDRVSPLLFTYIIRIIDILFFELSHLSTFLTRIHRFSLRFY